MAGADGPAFLDADFRLRVGVTPTPDLEGWTSFELSLVNRGRGDFDGRIILRGLALDAAGLRLRPRNAVAREVHIPPGERRQYTFLYRTGRCRKMRVDLRADGFRDRFEVDLPRNTPRRVRLLAITDPLTGFSTRQLLDAVVGDLEKHFLQQSDVDSGQVLGERRPGLDRSQVTSDSLPVDGEALGTYEIIVLAGTRLDLTPPEQLGALRRWVERGGALVACPDATWLSGVPEEVQSLLGIRLDGKGDRPPLSRELLPYLREGTPEFFGQLVPRESTRLLEDGLLFEHRAGAGVAFTLAAPPLEGTYPASLDETLLQGLRERLVTRVSAFPGRAHRTLGQLEGTSPVLLFARCGFQIPRQGQVALAFTLYLLIGFIVPGIVFKILRRREWTFAVVILVSILATVGIYRFGLLSSLSGLEVDELSVHRFDPDGRTTESLSFLGVIGPSLREYTLPVRRERPEQSAPSLLDAAEGLLFQPVLGGALARGGREVPVPDWVQVSDDGRPGEVPTMDLYPNSMVYGRAEYRSRLGTAWFEPAPGDVENSIQVRNPFDSVLRVFLVREGLYQFVTTLSPGNEVFVNYREGLSTGVRPGQQGWIQDFQVPNEFWRRLSPYYYHHSGRSGPALPNPPDDVVSHAVLKIGLQALARPDQAIQNFPGNSFPQPAVTTGTGPSTASTTGEATDSFTKRREPTLLVGFVETATFPIDTSVESVRQAGFSILVAELPVEP